MLNLGIKSNIVILTGAGISQESGINTFRDQKGLWHNYKIEEVATPEAYFKNPQLVLDFYNERKKHLLSSEIKPNAAHFALARLEHTFRGLVTIITQNVDNLHERAGSQNVIHLHGELLKVRCPHCQMVFECLDDISQSSTCISCHKTGLRPHIVWFGEEPHHMNQCLSLLDSADLFLAIGTSGVVYPAASFVRHCPDATKIEINTEETSISHLFHQTLLGPATIKVPEIIDFIIDQ